MSYLASQEYHDWATDYLVKYSDDPKILNSLLEAVDCDDADLSSRAEFILFRIGNNSDYRFNYLLNTMNREVPGRGICYIGYRLTDDDRKYIPQLIESLNSEISINRYIVIDALEQFINDEVVLNRIIGIAKYDPDQQNREFAMSIISNAPKYYPELKGNPDIINLLFMMLDNNYSADVCIIGIKGLKYHYKYNENIKNKIYELLTKDESGRVRTQALVTLSSIGDIRLTGNIIMIGLQDKDNKVRNAAVQILLKLLIIYIVPCVILLVCIVKYGRKHLYISGTTTEVSAPDGTSLRIQR